jgi:UDP-glucuronate 4-epimerase
MELHYSPESSFIEQAPSLISSENDSETEELSVSSEVSTSVPPHTGKKTVLVTGGAGFIGSHVAEHLLTRGDNVVIVDEMNDYYDTRIKEANLTHLQELLLQLKSSMNSTASPQLTIYRGDICDADFMNEVFETERIQWVVHMAARAGVRPSINDPFVYIHSSKSRVCRPMRLLCLAHTVLSCSDIKGTTQLMELAAKYGVQNFVFASSSSVYGGSKSTFFSEDENVDHPVSPYAASKKACELLAYTYHHLYNLNISGLRFFTVYGPRGRPDMAPFKFIDRISRNVEIQQFGDGSSSRDYTYIDDIVDGIVRALDRPHPYEIFNLGKGSGTSLSEFIDLVQKYTGEAADVRVMPDQPGDVPYTCADVSKAYRLLGYRSTVSFEEGIRRTVQWYNTVYKERKATTTKNSGGFGSSCRELSHDLADPCPEMQANGRGRAPSMVDLTRMR